MTEDEYNNPTIPSAEKFSIEVEKRYVDEGVLASYIEITSGYLEELGIEADEGKSLISKTLFDKIHAEAMSKNLLKEKNTTVSLLD